MILDYQKNYEDTKECSHILIIQTPLYQKNYEDTKECSHILIIQTPLYNILHDCNFYAVLSKLTKLALLLFYPLQTFFEIHHFSTYTV